MCSDRSFVVSKMEEESTGEVGWRVRGTVKTPGNGFQYRFNWLGAKGREAYMSVQMGQPLRVSNNAQGWAGQLQVEQKFMIAPPIDTVRIRIEGLSAYPSEIICYLTPQNRLK
jgi:hypothetical protein